VGLGLAGDEAHPLAPFAGICDAAAERGLKLVHHAGETAGPASVREALDLGHADRIGHGIRALGDPDVVAELRDRRVPLEVCPSSNIALGLVPSAAEHPFPAMLAAGLQVTLNTDVPDVTGAGLADEYQRAGDRFALTDEALAAVAGTAILASFASDDVQQRILAGQQEWLEGNARTA
jgi:adenosine deaminase